MFDKKKKNGVKNLAILTYIYYNRCFLVSWKLMLVSYCLVGLVYIVQCLFGLLCSIMVIITKFW